MKNKSFTQAFDVLPESLLNALARQYAPREVERIVDGYMARRPVTLRANRLKTDVNTVMRRLWDANLKCDRVPWYADALILKSAPLRALTDLDLYKQGEIYVQSLSSMLPPLALAPKKGMRVLDMAAAPGGKATQLASLTDGEIDLTVNEPNALRAETLKYNLDLQGVLATLSTVYGQQLSTETPYDAILLDAPCSGSGTVSAYDSRTYRPFSEKLVRQSARIQGKLLARAAELLAPGGTLVYSTCSILREENEDNLTAFLSAHPEMRPISLSGRFQGLPLLPCAVPEALLVSPSRLFEGFFISRMVKDR